MILWLKNIRPISENTGNVKRKFSIYRIGIFWRFFWKLVDNIPNICWVCNKTLLYANSDSQLYQNYFLVIFKNSKMSEISGMDWAHHIIKMDFNLLKVSEMAKKDPQKIIQGVSAHFTVLQYQEFAAISSNLIKTAKF